jgi:hypothetical protein
MNKRDVKNAVGIGQILLKEKEIILGEDERKKGLWGRYRVRHYPGLEAKTAQRYMQLAEHVDLEKHPTLAYLGQTKLLRLIQLGDGKTPAEVLDDEGVDIEFDVKDADARKQFQSETADLIKELAPVRRGTKGGQESSNEPGEEAVKVLKNLHQLLHQPEELEGLKNLIEEDEELQVINKSVRIKLRKLPPKPSAKKKISNPSGKLSDRRKGKKKKVSATG